MNVLRLPADPARVARTAFVLLPGAYNSPQDFLDAGFAEVARTHGLDLWLPELDLTQLSNGEAPALVLEHALRPARAAGAEKVWLGGVSLGGFNSLCLIDAYPDAADGLCLLAPWPGSRIARKQIDAAGGLSRWQPSAEALAADAELRVWHWIARHGHGQFQRPIHLGWGADDRFAGGIAAYAEALPCARRDMIAGGHDWAAWGALWRRFCAANF